MDATWAHAERWRKQLHASSFPPGDANPHSGYPDFVQRTHHVALAGCEPCAACLHCGLCSTCTDCYKCFTTPIAVDSTALDTQQRAMSIQSVTSWPHSGRMEGSSVSRCAVRRSLPRLRRSLWHQGVDAVARCSSAPPRRRRARQTHVYRLTDVWWVRAVCPRDAEWCWRGGCSFQAWLRACCSSLSHATAYTVSRSATQRARATTWPPRTR